MFFTLLCYQARRMQAVHILDGRTVCGAWWPPVVEATRVGQTMRQPMCNAEAAAALQLGEHNDHLPASTTENYRVLI